MWETSLCGTAAPFAFSAVIFCFLAAEACRRTSFLHVGVSRASFRP